ncbi:armadillo-type protein [Mycena latifolia]|nr:armadillo-type protein [Mycena latifolia]
MPPLTRQRTLESILSWWSDSNHPGPTLNLHAAAKPVMKLMYDRQALTFVKRNRGVALSRETVEIYWSYVSWKYVPSSTKIAIVKELKSRAQSEEDARVLIHSNMVYKILQFLRSSSCDMDGWLIWDLEEILWILARHRSDNDVKDIAWGFDLLADIARSPHAAEGIVAANALHYLLDGLGSLNVHVRQGACQLTQALARHKSTAATVIAIKPCPHLVALSSGRDSFQAAPATDALIAIANWPDGAEAAVAAHVLDYVPQWFTSLDRRTRRSACELLADLARHKSTAGAVIDCKPCELLVTILKLDPDDYLALCASEALINIAKWPDGAEAMVTAKVLDHVSPGLVSRSPGMHRSACDLLAALARHESTAQAVARAIPRTRLVALLWHPHFYVRESADKALQAINDYFAGPMYEDGVVIIAMFNDSDLITGRI